MKQFKNKTRKPKYLSNKESFMHISTFLIFNLLILNLTACTCQPEFTLTLCIIGSISVIFIIMAFLKKLTENIVASGWGGFTLPYIFLQILHLWLN